MLRRCTWTCLVLAGSVVLGCADTPVETDFFDVVDTRADDGREGSADVPGDVPPADTPVDLSEDAPSETPADAPADTPSEVPSDGSEDAPGEAPTDVPTDGPDDAPTDAPPDVPADVFDTADVPADTVPDGGSVCGGIAGLPCPRGQVCDIRSCGPDATGTCVLRPSTCPMVYAPVCGCDGITYGNDCLRLQAGAALDHTGECGVTALCGGIAGLPCPRGQVCDIRSCGPDATGTCVLRPSTCPMVYDPVCGCDGITYGNDCLRLQAGVALDHTGECGRCVPECRSGTVDPGEWVDPCTGTAYCRASCESCRAVCRNVGTRSEGWYADCADGTDGGCIGGLVPQLIVWADCG